MANRETILEEIAYKLSVCPTNEAGGDDPVSYFTVKRKPITTAKELNEIANPLFPVVNIIGGLPVPGGGRAVELGAESHESSVRSQLDVFINVFGYNKVNPDTEVSTLLNLVYQNLYYDPNLKGYDYTDQTRDVLVDTGKVIFCTENSISSTTKFKLMECLVDDFGVTENLVALPYTNPAYFTDVTDSLTAKAYSTAVRPSTVTEYRDPYFVFMLILSVKYNHKTYNI